MRKYLCNLRTDKNKTQQEVATMLGISRQYNNMIENGVRQKKLDMTMAKKLADIFGVTLEFIYDHEREAS